MRGHVRLRSIAGTGRERGKCFGAATEEWRGRGVVRDRRARRGEGEGGIRRGEATSALWLLRHGASAHGHCELVETGLRAARVPCRAEVVVRGDSGRLFGRDVICCGQRAAVDDLDELVLSPSIFVVIETPPEGSESSLNLSRVSSVLVLTLISL